MLFVSNEYRGQGVGKQLLQYDISLAEPKNKTT